MEEYKSRKDKQKEKYINKQVERIKRLKAIRKEGLIPVEDNNMFFDNDTWGDVE